MQHEDYSSYIVESLLAVRILNQDLLTKKCNYNWWNHLYFYLI